MRWGCAYKSIRGGRGEGGGGASSCGSNILIGYFPNCKCCGSTIILGYFPNYKCHGSNVLIGYFPNYKLRFKCTFRIFS